MQRDEERRLASCPRRPLASRTPPAIGDVGLDLVLPHTVHCWRFMKWEQQAKERTMQAVAFTQTGAPEVLRVLEVPDPTPGPGQVRIQVKVSGVNFRDIGVRRNGTNEGSRIPQPVVTGIEAAGVVESLGAGVTHLRVGQRTGVYTREQAPEAHRLLEGRLSQGKLALVHPN